MNSTTADSPPHRSRPGRHPSMGFARALCLGAIIGAAAFASLLAVQVIKVGKTGYSVPNLRTMPDGRRTPAFTWDLRLLNLPARLLHRHTRLAIWPQVVEHADKPRPTRPGWSFAAWLAVGVGGYAMSFAGLGALTWLVARGRRAVRAVR